MDLFLFGWRAVIAGVIIYAILGIANKWVYDYWFLPWDYRDAVAKIFLLFYAVVLGVMVELL